MNDKCSKYEGLFIFSDEETLQQHVAECEECRAEHEKMERVSELLDEVKFYYRKKRESKLTRLRLAYGILLVCLFTFTYGFLATDDEFMDTLKYGESLTAEDLGFPVDSYGLLMVDE